MLLLFQLSNIDLGARDRVLIKQNSYPQGTIWWKETAWMDGWMDG